MEKYPNTLFNLSILLNVAFVFLFIMNKNLIFLESDNDHSKSLGRNQHRQLQHHDHKKTHKVFIDLGANTGDSTQYFLENSGTSTMQTKGTIKGRGADGDWDVIVGLCSSHISLCKIQKFCFS